jgi:hypothetical protein
MRRTVERGNGGAGPAAEASPQHRTGRATRSGASAGTRRDATKGTAAGAAGFARSNEALACVQCRAHAAMSIDAAAACSTATVCAAAAMSPDKGHACSAIASGAKSIAAMARRAAEERRRRFMRPLSQVRQAFLNRSAFVTTETELRLIATAAMTGERRMPKKG